MCGSIQCRQELKSTWTFHAIDLSPGLELDGPWLQRNSCDYRRESFSNVELFPDDLAWRTLKYFAENAGSHGKLQQRDRIDEAKRER